MSTRVVAATMTAYRRSDRLTPDCDQLKRLVSRGLTDQQIADWTLEHLGNRVSRTGILKARERCGVMSAKPRGEHTAELPWKVASEDQQHSYAKNLRLLGRERTGPPLKRDEVGMLRKFKAMLDEGHWSIWYDRDHPQKWFRVPREPERGERFVRYPDGWEGPRLSVDD